MNKIPFFAVFCLYANFTFSQVVSWQEIPKWDSVSMLSNNLLCVEQSGKWGVISLDGTQIVPCENTKVTEVCEGRFLVINDNNELISLHKENGQSFPIEKGWFVDKNFSYFINNYLAIHNSQMHWGFLNLSGKVAIELNNDYIYAYPFFYNLAAVRYNDKTKSWGYIYPDGRPLKFESSKISNGYKYISFASSFTKMSDGNIVALIRLYDSLYMIDQKGNIVSHIIPKNGVPIKTLDIVPGEPVLSGIFSFEFNETGEIVSLKKGYTEYTSHCKKFKGNISFPTVNSVTIDSLQRIIVDKVIISSQFQKIIPLSSKAILVKMAEKWGLLNIVRDQDAVSIQKEKQTNSEWATFEIINGDAKTTAYYVDATGERKYLKIDENNKVYVQIKKENKEVRIGLETDGIRLEPLSFSVNMEPPLQDVKGWIKVIQPIDHINDGSKAVFILETTRSDCDNLIVEIDGVVIHRGVSKKKKNCISAPIMFKGRKEAKVNVRVKNGTGQTVYKKQFRVFCK